MLLVTLLPLCACSMISGKQSSSDFNEQLYVDARLNFAIKHPLDWRQQQVPVSQPEYRADTVTWVIKDLQQQSTVVGTFLIRSTVADKQKLLPDLLSEFLSTRPELKTGRVTEVTYPAGPALKMLGHDLDRGRLTIALKGQQRDFIISLNYPSDRFDDLLPIFEEIADSFVEILSPNGKQN
ncbi:MAG TPA: hypothetical protein VIR78_07545 [Malonomonas sp.]